MRVSVEMTERQSRKTGSAASEPGAVCPATALQGLKSPLTGTTATPNMVLLSVTSAGTPAAHSMPRGQQRQEDFSGQSLAYN